MRILLAAALVLVPALTLGACASDDGNIRGAGYRESRTQRLERDCMAHGGTLVPSGRLTGEAPLDNVCHNPTTSPNLHDH